MALIQVFKSHTRSILHALVMIGICYGNLQAQKQGNTWYFGYSGGLDFNSGIPIPIYDGKLQTLEGCATISDNEGKLLFYTDGINVWSKSHFLMPNGTGLLGNPSSSQSGVIVPQPNNPNIYYIFTVPAFGAAEGLQYSIVDMTVGPEGDVVSKNNPLSLRPMTEKITAVLHSNQTDIWVIAHELDNNKFLAYLITEDGLNQNTIISEVGPVHEFDCVPEGGAQGYMKAAPNGKKIALTAVCLGRLELYDFDNNTGLISNPIVDSNARWAYGVEFSSNSKYLYTSQWPYDGDKAIYQYDLSNYQESNVLGSKQIIGATDETSFNGALQLAPDEKIYLTIWNKTYLSVIHQPNLPGLDSDFELQGVNFGTNNPAAHYGGLGLPNFIQSYFQRRAFSWSGNCLNAPVFFNISDTDEIQSVSWNFGDPQSGTANTSNEFAPSHTFSSSGAFTVVLLITFNNNSTQSISQVIEILPLLSTASGQIEGVQEVCKGTSTQTYTAPQVEGASSYIWYIPEGLSTISGNISSLENQISIPFDNNSQDTQISVVAQNACGISTQSWELMISFKECEAFFLVPDAFTPNNDGLNDKLELFGRSIQNLKFTIYNRWGEVIFEAYTLDTTWDGKFNGKPVQEGIYIWKAVYENQFETGKKFTKTGKLHVAK